MTGKTVKPAYKQWPELAQVASDLASDTLDDINCLARETKTKESCPYKEQAILEMLIIELQKRV